ncbi:MAG: hypothetical protein J5959_04515 [Butyrivibrio sp.]|nr:hypothetical protein [Butyrivibrio sp.]MBP3238606.1 hypothetical protein [Lachnospiraceae bacterium]
MMNKLLLQVDIPAIGKSYEMKVPRQLKVKQLTDVLRTYFAGKGFGNYIPGNDVILCDSFSGKVFDSNSFIDQLGLKNGTKILFI